MQSSNLDFCNVLCRRHLVAENTLFGKGKITQEKGSHCVEAEFYYIILRLSSVGK